ncbi:MAG: GAF domain-containing protein [Bacteroidota bacterium]
MVEVISQPTPEIVSENAGYLPVCQFIAKITESKDANPYPSTFSFAPFLEKIEEDNLSKDGDISIAKSLFEIGKNSLSLFDDPEHPPSDEDREQIFKLLFPSLFFEKQLGFVAKPFGKGFFYITPALRDMFDSDDWEIKMAGDLPEGKIGTPIIEAGKLILNSLHGQDISLNTNKSITFRNIKNGLTKQYKTSMIFDYARVIPKKEVTQLEPSEIHEFLNNWDNEDYWLDKFPPEDYAFEGFVVGYFQNVTETEVLSSLKELMVDGANMEMEESTDLRKYINEHIRSFLQMPDVVFGSLFNREFKYGKLISWSILGDLSDIKKFDQDDFCECGSYGKVFKEQETVLIGDLKSAKEKSTVEKHLAKQGYRSLLLSPQLDSDGHVIGIMELASKLPYRFNQQMLNQLQEIISLFAIGTNRWISSMDNNVNFFIQKQFTYIHPSVEWKFREVSQKYLFDANENGSVPVLEPIVFRDVYPIYGQADIVGSSSIRNRSIEADMLDNLQRVHHVMKHFRNAVNFNLLDIYIANVEDCIRRIDEGGFISSDESVIVDLLSNEIHPLLKELSERYPSLPHEELEDYFNYLDPRLNIVYRKRRDYEDSVQAINNLIGNYIDQEVAKKQEILPHFFEKYITDGVEYNIYLGESIVADGQFSEFNLKDFRLWQLILMCEVTKLVEENKGGLLVPLTTAQLIFVYNNSLSIRFNMDEKQFDVDGAYNVRYEILKKRIDKAYIKGTTERLTQEGKIAIVWLQDRDRAEYIQYIDHLVKQGYVTDDVEELELEKLQGADGLKAFRLTVA